MKFNKKEPIYIQIVNEIENKILNGNLKPGDQIESVRQLSIIYQVTPNTIQKVYKVLEESNIIEKRTGLGTYIVDNEEILTQVKEKKIKRLVDSFVKNFIELGITYDEIEDILVKTFEEAQNDKSK